MDDARLAIELGADAVGFIFVPESPRRVTPDTAREIIRRVAGEVHAVGVFVDEDEHAVKSLVRKCGLDTLQFHGDESPEYCDAFPQSVIRAIRVKDADSLGRLADYEYAVEAFLLDAHTEDKRGGTGKTFDWDLALKAKKYEPAVIISGGLNPENVVAAIEHVQPFGVDVASGVERAPGIKDPEKLRNFIAVVRNAEGAESDIT